MLNCRENGIELPSELIQMGFEPNSVYHMYFLDHEKEEEGTNLHEIVLMPFSINLLDELYSITIRLKNVPNAMAHAVEILSKEGIEIKTSSAIDSIAGTIGSLDAIIHSKKSDIKDIDKIFEHAIESDPTLSFYIDNPKILTGNGKPTPDGKIFGQYISGRKYITDFKKFLQAIQKGIAGLETILNFNDNKLNIEIHPDILLYLNEKYGGNRKLSEYTVALRVDTQLNNISMSFFNPNDLMLLIEFIVKDHPGVVHTISNFFGDKQINFRIVAAKNLRIGYKMKIECRCDISLTEYPIYTRRALKYVFMSEILTRFQTLYNSNVNIIEFLSIKSAYGYPKQLNNFKPDDRFDLINIYHVMYEDDPIISHRLSEHFLVEESPESERDLFILLKQMKQQKFTLHVNQNLELQGIQTRFPIYEVEEFKFLETHTFILLKNNLRRIWINYIENNDIYVMISNNVPPINLHNKFFKLLPKDTGKLTTDRFLDICKDILSGLTYGFPTSKEFEQLGKKDIKEYIRTSKYRFEQLGDQYIEEKLRVDEFPIEGNKRLANCIAEYIEKNSSIKDRNIQLIDIGPGVGALTTWFVLRELLACGIDIENNVSLTLVDVSEKVLKDTISGNFKMPQQFVRDYFIPITIETYQKILAKAEIRVGNICDLKDLDNKFDFVVSGFTHHHLNNEARKLASEKMCELAKDGGFIGLVDETLTYVQYLEYRMNHLLDKVQPSVESFIQHVNDHIKYFEDAGIVISKKEQPNKYYFFSGVKVPQKKSSWMSFLSADLWDYSEATKADEELYSKILSYLHNQKIQLQDDKRYKSVKMAGDCLQVFSEQAIDCLNLAFDLQKSFEIFKPKSDYPLKGFRIILSASRCFLESLNGDYEYAGEAPIEAARIDRPMKTYIKQNYENPNQIWCTENFYSELRSMTFKNTKFEKLPRIDLDKDYPSMALYRIILIENPYNGAHKTESNGEIKSTLEKLTRIITSGETEEVEFKSSLRYDFIKGTANKDLEQVIVRTIVGFMNSEKGGTLLIGVKDDNTILGLQKDYNTFNERKNKDGFQNQLTNIILEGCGKEWGFLFHVHFHNLENKEICEVIVKPSSKPVFVKEGNSDNFYVRIGNSTRQLDPKDAHGYIMMRWYSEH
jgi:SAM-dependent methyltransferase